MREQWGQKQWVNPLLGCFSKGNNEVLKALNCTQTFSFENRNVKVGVVISNLLLWAQPAQQRFNRVRHNPQKQLQCETDLEKSRHIGGGSETKNDQYCLIITAYRFVIKEKQSNMSNTF